VKAGPPPRDGPKRVAVPRHPLVLLLTLLAWRCGGRAGEPGRAARRLLRGRACVTAPGQAEAGPRHFTSWSELPQHRLGGASLPRDRAATAWRVRGTPRRRGAFRAGDKQYGALDAAPAPSTPWACSPPAAPPTRPRSTTPSAQFARVETLLPPPALGPRALQARPSPPPGRAATWRPRPQPAGLARVPGLRRGRAPAQFEIARRLALQGSRASRWRSSSRSATAFPDSPWARTALERTTALYRLFGGAKPAFSRGPVLSPSRGRRASGRAGPERSPPRGAVGGVGRNTAAPFPSMPRGSPARPRAEEPRAPFAHPRRGGRRGRARRRPGSA